jgi:hypothetical protein
MRRTFKYVAPEPPNPAEKEILLYISFLFHALKKSINRDRRASGRFGVDWPIIYHGSHTGNLSEHESLMLCYTAIRYAHKPYVP